MHSLVFSFQVYISPVCLLGLVLELGTLARDINSLGIFSCLLRCLIDSFIIQSSGRLLTLAILLSKQFVFSRQMHAFYLNLIDTLNKTLENR